MSRYTDAVERNTEGLEFLSPGATASCHECTSGLDLACPNCEGFGEVDVLDDDGEMTGVIEPCEDCAGSGERAPTDDELQDAGGFSWSPCDACGSSLGGDRYPAHGRCGASGSIIHLDICQDCVLYLANGDEPDGWRSSASDPGDDDDGDDD